MNILNLVYTINNVFFIPYLIGIRAERNQFDFMFYMLVFLTILNIHREFRNRIKKDNK